MIILGTFLVGAGAGFAVGHWFALLGVKGLIEQGQLRKSVVSTGVEVPPVKRRFQPFAARVTAMRDSRRHGPKWKRLRKACIDRLSMQWFRLSPEPDNP